MPAGTGEQRHLRRFTILYIKKQSVHYRILRSYKDTLHGRSGETRTRGLLLPKQARYQLRNTPTSGGTAAPPGYSISFFARFVNTESAADGAARSAFFQSAESAAGNSRKGHDDRCLLRELGVALAQLPKREHKNYTECKTCCTLVASWPERCYHNTISPGSAAVGN